MLRFEYMPSDFNPLFLFIGEGADLAALAKLLRRFADHPQEIAVAERIPGATSQTTFGAGACRRRVRHARSRRQLQLEAERLAGDAYRGADRSADAAGRDSGSEILEVGSEGEIPVKVSRGEFTDDFLIDRR